MVRNISIKMLKEIAKKNKFGRTKMASLLNISVEQYDRWMKGTSFTNQANTLRRIAEVIEEHKEAS